MPHCSCAQPTDDPPLPSTSSAPHPTPPYYTCTLSTDAMASEVKRKGDVFMSKWAEVMTNMQPKTYFLRPDVALQMGVAIVREVIEQKIMGKPDR